MSHPYQPAPTQGPPAGQPPYDMPPVGYAPQGGQQPDPRKGSGLAIAALVLGIIALLLCWVPIINNFAAVLAVVGLALGIPALISARRGKRTGSGLAVAGVVLSVVALVGVFATQAFYGEVIDDVTEEINNSAVDPTVETDSSAVDSEASADAATDVAAAPSVLPVGQSGELSEYTVTVDSVTPNGNDVVANENQFNEAPTGQYVLVGLTVTYNGADEGDPWLDLTTEFVGTDARKYDTSSCFAVIPNEATEVPTLLSAGTASYQVCMDVPPTAIEGGQVEVSESFSFEDDSLVWAIQ
ncbi:DUF4190 domain-containing protein [Modestobacter sp. VKM Ac-2983]|uniref:DUF4190 domain-containing protein n=1 Tax=Modestobacter sp. VKM Ac-2983 TaxID=3004137 RepID=UPI0022AB5EF1|nr:DUF4190 domain-containing protein [Modestobacter sp. VKM Ac-2983]MCZ2804884.1 DUF4190 domain-containing protein [Modestobacter sp. VKM Ac-2983]